MKKISKFTLILSLVFLTNSEIKSQNLCESFTSSTFPPTGWNIEYTGTNYWTRAAVSGYGQGTGSAKFDYYTATQGIIQSMITMSFTATAAGDSLKFDHAYCTYQTEVDILTVYTSIDGGTTYTTLVVLPGGPVVGQGMVTAPPQLTAFTPTASQWAHKNYLVPPGTNKIKFEATSAFGNNLFLDNICIVSLTGIISLTGVPNTYSLSQNYPNPFNPATTIRFTLPAQSYALLTVYDIAGRLVDELINRDLQSGSFEIAWDASGFPSGTYFYRLSAGDFSDVKKMTLIK